MVQGFYAVALSAYAAALGVYHVASPAGLDRQARAGVVLMSSTVLLAWVVYLVLRFGTRAVVARHSSALHACQSALLVGILCWGMPLTAR